jgi:RNA polymerase sigma factor (sigma-70 family)
LDALLAEKGDVFEGFLSRMSAAQESPPYTPYDLGFLGRLFAALPEEDREILILREAERLPYEAIAERLHGSVDAVKGRLKRARQNLTDKCRKFF